MCRATPGLAGATPGNLTFSSDFEGGNIGFARAADNGLEYDINVRQDTYGPKHRLWFHFQMRGGAQGMVWLICTGLGRSYAAVVHNSISTSHPAEIVLQHHPAEPVAIWSDSEHVRDLTICKTPALQHLCIAAPLPCWLSQL